MRRHHLWIVAGGLVLLAALALGCAKPWEEGAHSATTEAEFYVEGQTWRAAQDQDTHVDSVMFSTRGVEGLDGWVHKREVWYDADWVNAEARDKVHLDEIAWHEVCHLSTQTDHQEAWCKCMTQRHLSIYCR